MTKLRSSVAPALRFAVVLLKRNDSPLITGRVILEVEGVRSWIPVSGHSYGATVKLARSVLRTRGIEPGSVGIYSYGSKRAFEEHRELQSGKPVLESRPKELKARIVQFDAGKDDRWEFAGKRILRIYMRFEGESRARFKAAVLLAEDSSHSIRSLQFGQKPPAWFLGLVVKAFAKSK